MNFLAIVAFVIASLSQTPQSTDKGLIGYFEGSCPKGWEEYDGLIGKVAVGAGNYIGTAEDGRTEAIVYVVGDTGGEVLHRQTVGEMANHDHTQEFSGGVGSEIGYIHIGGQKWGYSNVANRAHYTTKSGGNLPQNNMSPYLVLNACQKTTADNYTHQNDFLALQQEVDTNSNGFLTLSQTIHSVNETQKSNYLSLHQNIDAINETHQNDFLSLQQEVNTISNTQQQNIGNLNETYITLLQILLGLNETYHHGFNALQQESYAIKNSQQASSKDNNSFLMGFVGGLVGGVLILGIGTVIFCWYTRRQNKKSAQPTSYPLQGGGTYLPDHNMNSGTHVGENQNLQLTPKTKTKSTTHGYKQVNQSDDHKSDSEDDGGIISSNQINNPTDL